MLSLTKGSFSGASAGDMPITGEVHLGAVCKLFVPVQKEYIRQVSIAGVHINNARIFNSLSYAFSAEMNAVVVGGFAPGTASSKWTGKFHAGTAYCFSVVNIAEFMTNRANDIANANVAGTDTRTAAESIWYGDDQGLQYKDADGTSVQAQFGTIWPGYDSTTAPVAGTAGVKNTGQHKVNMGSNFDVVVHFDTAWCSAHWELIDMQKTGDHGEGDGTDSAGTINLRGFEITSQGAAEAKMDAWDKRLRGDVGSCGLCKDKGTATRSPLASATVSSDCLDNTWTAAADGLAHTLTSTETFDYHTATGAGGCTNLNEYSSGSTRRWPNAGAWAAFYSFVTCARSDYMIYGAATRTVRTVKLVADASGVLQADHLDEVPIASPNEAGSATQSNLAAKNNDNRMVVVGGWHQDYRHGKGACVRFNIRQVGENIKYCADGDEEQFNSKASASLYKNPTGNTQEWSQNQPKRCTWNWNYNQLSGTGSYDAEAWFDSLDPLHMQVWESGVANQAAAEKFIDEPLPGTTNTDGYKAAVVAATGTLTSDVVINVMLQERRRLVNGVAAGAFVNPNKLEMDGDYASAPNPTAFNPTSGAVTDFPLVANLYDGTSLGCWSKITLECKNAGKYNGGSVGAERMRDHFPDCFFGDEIHGQWTWDTADALKDVDSAANTAVWRFYAMLQ
jgi:hypothetical protein